MTTDPNYEAIGRYVVATEKLQAALTERSQCFKALCSYFDRLDGPIGEHKGDDATGRV